MARIIKLIEYISGRDDDDDGVVLLLLLPLLLLHLLMDDSTSNNASAVFLRPNCKYNVINALNVDASGDSIGNSVIIRLMIRLPFFAAMSAQPLFVHAVMTCRNEFEPGP